MGAINGHREAISGSKYRFLTTCDEEMGKEEFV